MALFEGESRVLQVHPTRACNLRCRHCYSSSGPEEGDGLPVALLREAVADAAEEGYTALAVSGGEPFVYPGLLELLEEARSLGLATTVTTNGLLLDPERLGEMRGKLDLLAISVDGVPESHDHLRDSPGAFAAMESRLQHVREAGQAFGFAFTLTRSNANELGWVADFALEQGASFLQVHPLEAAGRAAETLRGAAPDDFEAAFAWVVASRLRDSLRGRLGIHVDLLDRGRLRVGAGSDPAADTWGPQPLSALRAGSGSALREPSPLSDRIATLVVEADGTVVPLRYGFPRAFALGRLDEARLRFLAARWRAQRLPAFSHLCRRTIEELAVSAEPPIVNWHHEVARRATLWRLSEHAHAYW